MPPGRLHCLVPRRPPCRILPCTAPWCRRKRKKCKDRAENAPKNPCVTLSFLSTEITGRLYRLHRWHVCLRQRHRRHQPRRFLLVRLPAGAKQVAQKYDNQKQLPPPRGCFWFIKSHFAVKLKRFIKMNTTFLLYSTRKTVAIRARLQSCTQNPKND